MMGLALLDLPTDVVALILDLTPLPNIFRLICATRDPNYFTFISSCLRSFRLDLHYSDKLNRHRIESAFRLLAASAKDNIQQFDIIVNPSTIINEAELLNEQILRAVKKQATLLSFSLRYPYKQLPSQQAFFKSIASNDCITYLRSFRCNSSDVASHLLPLLEKTPHLEELVIDDMYSNFIGLLPRLPSLTPKLKHLLFCSTMIRESQLSWSCLIPLKEFKDLTSIVIPEAFIKKLGLQSALEHLPAQMAVNICFISGFYASNYRRSGTSFLHEAISSGALASAEDLIRMGAQVGRDSDDMTRFWRETPLNMASRRNMLDMCRLLLAAGASLRSPDPTRAGSLLHAISMAQKPTIEIVLNHAISEDSNSGIESLFDARNADSLFHVAARTKDASILHLCLSKCAGKLVDVNARNSAGLPALAYVASSEHAELLATFGADPNVLVGQHDSLIESMIAYDRNHDVAILACLGSPTCLAKIAILPEKIEHMLDARVETNRLPSWISMLTLPVLKCLFMLYPSDELEAMLQRIEFWSHLPSSAPVAAILIELADCCAFSWRPEITEALQQSLRFSLETNIASLARFLKERLIFMETALPLLVDPSYTKTLQERDPKGFKMIVTTVEEIITSVPVKPSLLSTIMFTCVENWKIGSEVIQLILTLLAHGARPISPDSSSSLVLEFCKRGYPAAIRALVNAQLDYDLFDPESCALEALSIARERLEARIFGWTAQLLDAMQARMEAELNQKKLRL